MILGGILKRSEDCSLPFVVPVSDASASSGDSDAECSRTRERLDRTSLTLPLEVGGELVPEELVNTRRRVSFGALEVRNYCIILGDNPCCEMGPPITIDWVPIKSQCIPIDDYEEKRGPRRTRDELQLGWIQRKQVLRKLACATDEEMIEAACEAQRVRDQRHRTLKSLPYEFLHLPVESIYRKVKRLCGRA